MSLRMRNIMVSPELIDGVMAHPFYQPDEKVAFDQQPKPEALSLSCRSTRQKHPQDVMNRSTRRTSPAKEAGGRGGSTKSRTRVACDRCRKRKIKCSGDKEDGRACTNCQSAGYANCHYVRVKATLLHTKVPGWPYPTMNDATSPVSGTNMYAPHVEQKAAGLSNTRVSPYTRLPNYDMGSVDSHSTFGRQSCGMDQGVSYEEQSPIVYGQQMLPNVQSQGVLNDYYGLAWNSKGWNTSPHETVFPDQGTDQALTQSAYSYMLPGQGAVPGVLQTDGRVDGNSSNHRAQVQNFPTLASAEAASGLPYSQVYRTENTWDSRCTPTAAHRGSMQSMTNEPFNMSPGHQIKPDPDMVVGFMPTMSPTGAFPGDLNSEDYRIPPDSRFTRAYSRDANDGHMLSISTSDSGICSPTDSYNYSSCGSERGRTHSEASETSTPATGTATTTTLANGLPYSSMRQPNGHGHGQNGLPFKLLSTDAATLSDYRTSTEMQRSLGY